MDFDDNNWCNNRSSPVGIVACEEIVTSKLLEALRLNSSHFQNEISLMDSCIRHIDD
jgi:hypothetical protein